MYWMTGLLGALFAIAPFVFGYAQNPQALWVSLLLGGGIVVLSAVEWISQGTGKWEYWTVGILGLVAVLAPFVFGFGSHAVAMWMSMIAGVLVIVLAGSKLFMPKPV